MEGITSLLSIGLAAVLVNNFVLSQFLGICPFMGVSKKVDTAVGKIGRASCRERV